MDTVRSDLHLQLILGDDYLAVDGRALRFDGYGVAWPAIAPVDVQFALFNPGNVCDVEPELQLSGVINWASVPPSVAFDAPRTETVKLLAGARRYQFEVRALMVSGSVITLARGLCSVLDSRG